MLIQGVGFARWLNQEMARRDWDRATLADHARLTPDDVRRLLDEGRPLNGRLCAALSWAFDASLAQIAGRAGLVGPEGRDILARYVEEPHRVLGDLWKETAHLSRGERSAIVDCVMAARKLRESRSLRS